MGGGTVYDKPSQSNLLLMESLFSYKSNETRYAELASQKK